MDANAVNKLEEIIGRFLDEAIKQNGYIDINKLGLILFTVCLCCIKKRVLGKGFIQDPNNEDLYILKQAKIEEAN